MDNVFILQKEYTKSIDGFIIKDIMANYANWYLDKFIIEGDNYSLLKREKLIPVGNLIFVQQYLDKKMKPIEVPEELRKYLNREYHIIKGKDIPNEFKNENYFFKDADTLKKWNNALNPYDLTFDKETNYVVSKRVIFDSEYRIFIYDNEILGLENYLGDILLFPDIDYIKDIINNYEGPNAYTLDIGIHDGKTDLIEIHPFVSCGLYGFYDKNIIPMLKEGFNWYEYSD